MAAPSTDRAFDLITSSIEPLIESRLSEKTGTSAHESRFAGYLGLWSSFEASVRHNTQAINWNEHQSVLQIRPADTSNAVHHEHYVCGDEKSVSARLVQNVFQPLIAVGKELGQQIEWSDAKASRAGISFPKDVPDFVALANGRELRLLGEAKTPWAHDIARAAQVVTTEIELWRRFGRNSIIPSLLLDADKCCLNGVGQIAKYMKKYEVKYGFYTTYEETIFLKKEWRARDGHWVLWHSRPISYNAISDAVDANLADLVGRVSLRECFFYLQTQVARGDWHATNKDGKWNLNKMVGSVNFNDYYANDDPNTQKGGSAPAAPGIPAQHQEPRRSERNLQTSAARGKKVLAPRRSRKVEEAQHIHKGQEYDQKRQPQRPSPDLSQLSSEGIASRSSIVHRAKRSDSTKSIARYRELGKDTRLSEQKDRAYPVKRPQPHPGCATDQIARREGHIQSGVQSQPSADKAFTVPKGLPLLHAHGGEKAPSATDSAHLKYLHRDQVLKPRSEAKTQQHRGVQPSTAQYDNEAHSEGRQRRREEEKKSRTLLRGSK